MPHKDEKKISFKTEDENKKNWKNKFYFWIPHIKIRLCDNFHENLRKRIDPFFKTFYSNWGKNKNANEKNWEKFDFWILHIKIRLNENFHENLKKKNDWIFKTFLIIWGKKWRRRWKILEKWARLLTSSHQN